MDMIKRRHSLRILYLAYVLFATSMVLPTISIDLGVNGGSVQPGYRVFIGGPVGAVGIILEPGGQQRTRNLGIYYLITWFANLALLLPFLTILPQPLRRFLAGVFSLLAWSVIGCFLIIPDNLIREIAVGYYLWAASITLVLFFVSVNTLTPARE
jgi:hypothetical protein